ncbi:MAG: DUF5610 domain-containing protein [Deltaproteobacteria bacterium]|nr:DUF5610 domain-containing protein [Deltaproteobacteria bacterium]
MDSLLASTGQPSQTSQLKITSIQLKYQLDVSIVASINNNDGDRYSVDFGSPEKAVALSAQEIVSKLNELLAPALPQGIEGLKPEETTPEASADRIVKSVSALFPAFAAQNPELSDEEVLDKFMEEVKKGVQQGYDEAFQILEGLGAFSFEGVQSGVEQTKILIDQKLDSFYRLMRESFGLPSKDKEVPSAEGKENGGAGSSAASATVLNRVV